jgi:hypothetical protein
MDTKKQAGKNEIRTHHMQDQKVFEILADTLSELRTANVTQ